MTLRYAHVSDRDVQAAAERIGKTIEAAMETGKSTKAISSCGAAIKLRRRDHSERTSQPTGENRDWGSEVMSKEHVDWPQGDAGSAEKRKPRSERKQRLLDQLELQLDELEASATEEELAAEQAAAETTEVKGFTRRRTARKPFPAHLPRERVVVPAPTSCTCCGSDKLSKIGEDVTETLEAVPRQWKVIQTVREKFTCRRCEKISQPPAPFHATPRGWAGPNLLAMILFEKYGQHRVS